MCSYLLHVRAGDAKYCCMVCVFLVSKLLLLPSVSSAQLSSERVECLDSCSVGGIVLGRDPNIGACCGLQSSGRNGGAFIIEDNSCRSCDGFRRTLQYSF